MACQLRKNTFKRAENVHCRLKYGSVTSHHHDLSYQINFNLCTLILFDINIYSSVQTASRRGSSRPSCVHATGQDCKSFKAEGHGRTQPRRCPRLLRRSPPTPRPVRSAGPHTSLRQVSRRVEPRYVYGRQVAPRGSDCFSAPVHDSVAKQRRAKRRLR